MRAPPGFAATVTVSVPEPVPMAGLTVAQVALLAAVQPHVERFAVRVTLLVPPVAAADNVFAESAKVQAADDWFTVYAWPPIVITVLRAAPVLAPTVIVTVPDPVPLVGLTVAQATVLAADQAQVVSFVDSVTVPVPPAEATESDDADTA